ncbi:MAG TPA: glycogen-binding domain-containing protein [Candidatus Sulfotelmatobacter sp.]|nr:glycogen-binding domain-containing protein [Candidatus Sulfotelmatobacter sp.]
MQPRHARSSTVARPVPPPAGATERPVEKPVEFVFHMPQAKNVTVAGSFNNWDASRTPMRKDAAGWKATVWLPPGRYEYRFVADGQWISDPNAKESARNDFGSTNSVITV